MKRSTADSTDAGCRKPRQQQRRDLLKYARPQRPAKKPVRLDSMVDGTGLGFLEKPVDLSVLLEKMQQTEQALAIDEDVAAVEEAVEESPLPLNIIAKSHAMKDVLSLVRRMAGSRSPVLINAMEAKFS